MPVKPQNIQAEMAVLKCLFQTPSLIYDVNVPLRQEMFYATETMVVFKVWQDLFDSGLQPDQTVVTTRLMESNQFDLVGGDEFFKKLDEADTIIGNFGEYVNSVVDSYILRCVIDAGNRLVSVGYSEESATALDIAANEFSTLLNTASFNATVPHLDTLVSSELVAFIERTKNPGSGGIPTGFADYDLLCGGVYETDEIIIAARPSAGKTSMALRLALNVAINGMPVLIQSYEMSNQQLTQRLLSMVSKVDLSRIRSGMVESDEYTRVAEAAKITGKLPIYINNDATATVSDLVATARKMIRDKGIKLFIVDYLQLMPHRIEYATLDLGYIARRFKNLAVDSKIVVVPISQLNRLVEMRADKVPILSDLRQSGNLEEHSDLVWMIYREEMYEPELENRGLAKIYIRKNRNGPIGVISLRFVADYCDFLNKETF